MTAVRLARGATGRDHDREVRRLLPRPPRRAARRRRQRRRHARAPGLGRRHAGRGRRHRRRPVQRRSPRSTPRSPSTSVAAVARRADRRQHGPRPARARLPRRTSRERCTDARRAPRVRRGDHRVPASGPAASRAASGITPGPLDLRQGRRRRPPARRGRRARRRHGPPRARSAPCTRPARCAGTRSRPRPGLAALGALDAAGYVDARGARRRGCVDGLRGAFDDAGVPAVATRAATLGGLFFAAAPVTDYEGAQRADHAALRARSSTACSTAACSSRRAATRRCSCRLAHTDDDHRPHRRARGRGRRRRSDRPDANGAARGRRRSVGSGRGAAYSSSSPLRRLRTRSM